MENMKIIVVLALSAAACGVHPTAATVIGPAGGAVVVDNGRLTLDFPAGAVAANTTITARRVDASPPLLVGYELGPEGLTFTTRPRITVRLDEAVDPIRHAIAKRRADGAYELDSNPEFDSVARTVSATLGGFSQHGVILCPSGCPSSVDNVEASPQADGSMRVTWSVITGRGAIGTFFIERAGVPGLAAANEVTNFQPLASVSGDQLQYVDRGLCAATTYRYRVRPFAVATYGAAADSPPRISSSQIPCSVPSPTDGGSLSLCSLVSVSTLAGTGQRGRTDGPASTATFSGPLGVAIASNGDVYVADGLYPAIRRISASGTVSTLTTTAGNSPLGVAIDAAGKLYVTSTSDCRIFTVDSGGTTTLLAGSTCGFQDGAGQGARFTYPAGIAVHANGTVYVADSGNHRIRAITPAGVVTTLAGSGASGSADGVGAAASFALPVGVALSGGTLYVSDYVNNNIRQIDIATGAVTTRLSSSVLGSQGQPTGIAVDTFGNLLFMSHGGSTLNLLPPGSFRVELLAGANSRQGGQFADGVGCDARFDDVEGLAVSGRRVVMGEFHTFRVRQATLP